METNTLTFEDIHQINGVICFVWESFLNKFSVFKDKLTAANIALENGYDNVLYSFKKHEKLSRGVNLPEKNETWTHIPCQKYITIIKDDHGLFEDANFF